MPERRIKPGDGDPRHGTYNGYRNLGCRCDDCRAANAAHSADLRTRRSLAPNDPRHGRHTTYTNYACRCDACWAANAEYSRGVREYIRGVRSRSQREAVSDG